MRLQRVRDAESRIEMQIAKWTAEGMVKGLKVKAEYSMTFGHTSVAGDMLVFRQEHASSMNQGGTAGLILIPSLTKSVGDGFFVLNSFPIIKKMRCGNE